MPAAETDTKVQDPARRWRRLPGYQGADIRLDDNVQTLIFINQKWLFT